MSKIEKIVEWISTEIDGILYSDLEGETCGERGFSLSFDPATKKWTLKAWVNDTFAWSGESSSEDIEILPEIFSEEND